jgi:hypothetical protein
MQIHPAWQWLRWPSPPPPLLTMLNTATHIHEYYTPGATVSATLTKAAHHRRCAAAALQSWRPKNIHLQQQQQQQRSSAAAAVARLVLHQTINSGLLLLTSLLLPCCPHTVCPRGFYEAASNSTRCSRCEAGSYCPGGDKAENPTSRGNIITCGANLVTRNTGARTQADCGE